MSDSLSVVWPVRNAERVLARQVQDLVELLPELTDRFELLIVDNGSSDFTDEVAAELAHEFPQVRWVRGQEPAAPDAAAERAIDAAAGDYVYLHAAEGPVDSGELRRQWLLRHRPLRAELQRRRPRALLSRLSDWAQQIALMADETLVAPASRLFRRDQAAAACTAGHAASGRPAALDA